MPRLTAKRLTQKMLDGAKPREKDWYLWDSEEVGLGLRVWPSGRKTWTYRWRLGRKQRIKRIGVYRDTAEGRVVMSLAEARTKARSWRTAVDQGQDPRSGARRGETVAELWPAFIEHKERREGLGERTIHGYQLHYSAHISNPAYGIADLDLSEVDRRRLVALRDAVADQGRARAEARYEAAGEADKAEEYLAKLEAKLPTAGNGAANSVMLTLGSFFSWLVGAGELDRSPVEGIRKLPTAGRDEALTLDRDDALHAMDLIREHASNDGHRDILLLLLLTAQRVADIRDRHWDDVILDDPDVGVPYLRIRKHKSRRRTRADKLVPLVADALAIILGRWPGSPLVARHGSGGWEVEDLETGESWPLLPASQWAARLPPAQGPIFPGADPSKPLSDVWHPWKGIAEHATRPRVRASDVHGLRHAAASLLNAAGVPLEQIQSVLYHGAKTTTKLYVHQTADAISRIGEALSGGVAPRPTPK